MASSGRKWEPHLRSLGACSSILGVCRMQLAALRRACKDGKTEAEERMTQRSGRIPVSAGVMRPLGLGAV